MLYAAENKCEDREMLMPSKKKNKFDSKSNHVQWVIKKKKTKLFDTLKKLTVFAINLMRRFLL